MSIEAIRQVTETEQANKQSRAAAEAEARQLVLDAERNGTELAAEQGKDLLRQAEERAALRAQEIAREAEAESRRQREQAEQHLDETAEFIVERVVKH